MTFSSTIFHVFHFVHRFGRVPVSLVSLSMGILGLACSCQPKDHQANHIEKSDSASSSSFDSEDWPPTWPEDLPKEELEPVTDCPTERCFVIEDNTTLCSLDPTLPEHSPPYFSDKSTLALPAGTYPLKEDLSFPDIALQIESPHGKTTLEPEGELRYYIDPKFKFHESFGLEDATFRSSELWVSDFSLAANFVDIWPQPHFRLGDPQNTFWWFNAYRRAIIKVREPSAIFPDIKDQTSIFYVPCDFPGQPDDLFVFHFEDQSRLELTVRTIISNIRIGFHAGVLLAAQGTVTGQAIEVRNRNHLAYYGSGNIGVRMYPPEIAIYTGPFDEHPETCGLLLKSQADPDLSPGVTSDGWAAYHLTCDKKTGKQIPLKSAEIPPKYEQP